MNTNRDNSDIDLVIQGEQVNLTELLEIKTALDDLLIPYKIDLSLFHQIDNPNLTAHIRRVGQVFYCRK